MSDAVPAPPEKSKVTAPAGSGGRKIKYMGIADVAKLEKGDNFGGTLPDGLERDLTFCAQNFWVEDASGLSEESVRLILGDSERFQEVTGLKLMPYNLNQTTFGGHGSPETLSGDQG